MKAQVEEYDRKVKQLTRKIAEDENKIAIMTQ